MNTDAPSPGGRIPKVISPFRRGLHVGALVLILPLLVLAFAVILARYLTCILLDVRKAWLIALSIDDAANVACNGRLGQSISSRAAVAWSAHKRWGCILCKLLDEVSPNHCAHALTAVDQNLEVRP